MSYLDKSLVFDFKGTIKDGVYKIRSLLPIVNNSGVILMYHSIDTNPLFFTVTPQMFERQMRWLREENYHTVSLDQLMEYRKAGTIPHKTIAVTFDDGYLDNYTNAFPILQNYRIPATIFVITGKDFQTDKLDLPKMSLQQMKELEATKSISIEPHTVTHSKLTAISEDAVLKEIRDSKEYLENNLTKLCKHFAYPKGRYNDMTKKSVSALDIPYAYGVEPGVVDSNSDSLALPRNSVDSAVSFIQFKAIVRGGRLRFR